MTKKVHGSRDPDIIAAGAALRRAAKRALQIGLDTNTPVYVLEKGRIVDLTEAYKRKAKAQPTRRRAT